VDLKRGLLLYLPFTGNFDDSSGNHNPTTSLGATLSTDAGGNAWSAMSGTGNGERVVVTNNGSIKFDSAFTISLNVFTNSTKEQTFASMANRTNAEGVSFGLGISTPSLTTVDFTVSDQRSSCTSGIFWNNSATDTSNLTLPIGAWYNLIAVFNRGTMNLYANGTLISTQKSISPVVPICPGSQISIGGWWDGDPQSINGKLDEVRLYDRALNTGEIAKLSQGFPVQSAPSDTSVADLKKGLLLYLPFNGSIADSSGNNNPTAAINGAALTYDEHGYANSAFGANGGGQTIQVTNNGSIQFDTAFSASLSFMTRDNSTFHCYMSMTQVPSGYGASFAFGTTTPNSPNFTFGVVDHTSGGCDTWGSGPNNVGDTTGFVPQIERWYNVVCIYHKGSIQTYINGVLTSSKSGTGTSALLCPNSKVIIGDWYQGENINGVIDNVRLYNRVLNPDEIALLAKNYQPISNSIRQTISTH
jgi:hypothetical protein